MITHMHTLTLHFFRGGTLFPTFVNYVKTPTGSPEDNETRGKLEEHLQAINDHLSKQVRACVRHSVCVCVCVCVRACVCVCV